jgi:hypothetical protein
MAPWTTGGRTTTRGTWCGRAAQCTSPPCTTARQSCAAGLRGINNHVTMANLDVAPTHGRDMPRRASTARVHSSFGKSPACQKAGRLKLHSRSAKSRRPGILASAAEIFSSRMLMSLRSSVGSVGSCFGPISGIGGGAHGPQIHGSLRIHSAYTARYSFVQLRGNALGTQPRVIQCTQGFQSVNGLTSLALRAKSSGHAMHTWTEPRRVSPVAISAYMALIPASTLGRGKCPVY